MKKRKLTEADRKRLARMEANIARTRRLAEQGLAELERKRGGPVRRPGQSNADWLRELAEKAQAELDAKRQR